MLCKKLKKHLTFLLSAFYQEPPAGKILTSDCILYEYNGKPMIEIPFTVSDIFKDEKYVGKDYFELQYNSDYKIFIPKGTVIVRLDEVDIK